MKVNGAPFDSPMFKSHVRNVFSVIGDAVNHIDDLDSLSPILKDLGVKHQGYGAKKEYLEVTTFKKNLQLPTIFFSICVNILKTFSERSYFKRKYVLLI